MNVLKPCRRFIKTILVATFASLILMTVAQSAFADLQITSPKAGDIWVQNSRQKIKWTYEGVPNTTILRLQLIQGGEFLGTIAENILVTRTSGYSWVVGNYQGGIANPGSNYRVCIEKARWALGQAESGIFTIRAAHGFQLKKGDVLIADCKAVPLNDAGKHLRITINISNQLAVTVSNLRLILEKIETLKGKRFSHQRLKEWKPIALGPHAISQFHYDDDLPNHPVAYWVLITTDLNRPVPPEETVLDGKEITFVE